MAKYVYDADGQRIQKTVDGVRTSYVYDRGRVSFEKNASGGITVKYLNGLSCHGENRDLETYYYFTNAHGDVTVVVDSGRDMTDVFKYDEFGNITFETHDPDSIALTSFRYANEYYDTETGNYYLRSRYYDPSIGRFTQADTFAGSITDPLSLNLYTYCHNNPINYVDPSGHAPREMTIGDSTYYYDTDDFTSSQQDYEFSFVIGAAQRGELDMGGFLSGARDFGIGMKTDIYMDLDETTILYASVSSTMTAEQFDRAISAMSEYEAGHIDRGGLGATLTASAVIWHEINASQNICYEAIGLKSFYEFYSLTIVDPNSAELLLYHLNDTDHSALSQIINDYVAHLGGMQPGNDNVFQVIYGCAPGYNRIMSENAKRVLTYSPGQTTMYDNYEFSLFDALAWLIQTGGSGNFAIQARVTNKADVAIAVEGSIVGKFMDASIFLRMGGFTDKHPHLYIGTTEGAVCAGEGFTEDEIGSQQYLEISKAIYDGIMSKPWLKGHEEIISGIYLGMENCKDISVIDELLCYVGEEKQLIWKPYVSERRSAEDIASFVDLIGTDASNFIVMMQPTLYFSNNNYIGDVLDSVGTRSNGARVGMQIEFDMGLVTGRMDMKPAATAAEKQGRFIEYLRGLSRLKENGYPISVYSGGPNEQGYRNIWHNNNTHNNGNHIPCWAGIDITAYATGVPYSAFPDNTYNGNLIYDINNYIYNDVWTDNLTSFLECSPGNQ